MKGNELLTSKYQMNNFPVPFKIIATALISSLLIIIGAVNLRDRIAWTDPADGIFWIESEGRLKAAAVDHESPGHLAGITPDDTLLRINGREITNLANYSDLIYKTPIGSRLSYSVSGSEGDRELDIRLGSKSLFSAKDGLKLLLAFIYLGIGIFVLIRGNSRPLAFHFYFICLAAFAIWLLSWTPRLSSFDWLVYWLSVVFFLLLPSLFLHFCMRFPANSVVFSKRIVPFYLSALFLFFTHFLWITGHLAPLGLPRTAHISGIIDRVELVFFSLFFLAGALVLLKKRFETRDLIIRQQMKWISYGTLAGIVPFSLIYMIPVLFGIMPNFVMDASILFLAFIPLSMGYALVHYKLMDVEVIARQGAAYALASSLLLALYLLFALILGKMFQWIAPQANFMAISLAVLVIALLFAPLRHRIQTWLDSIFYRDRFEARSTLIDFAQTLSSEISLAPLSHRIIERISTTFAVNKVGLFLSDPDHPGSFRLADAIGCDLYETNRLYREEELIEGANPEGLAGFDRGPGYLHCAGSTLVNEGFHYLQDLGFQGRNAGIIALGQLPGTRHFSSEDLDLLSALAGYAAIALDNAALYQSAKEQARELSRLKTYTENIIESIDVAVISIETSGIIRSCNRAFEDLFGTARQQITGVSIETLLSVDIMTSIQNVTGTAGWELNSPAHMYKLHLENLQGKRLIVNLSLIPLQNSPEDTGSLLVMDDITEKVNLEDQLMQAEKLSSIGLLAAGIAHEINTPITGISSYTQMLLDDTLKSDRRRSILKKIENQTFRAAEIVNGLLNFSRLNGSEFKAVDINQLINESLTLLDHQLELNHITVESSFDFSLPPIYGNTGKLQQVFVNLFLNARDAMPSGGELAVKTGMNESMVTIDISDTGGGISKDHIKKIFDPFFTTKMMGKGTGLGLAVTYGIIQEHGGRILVDSDSGKGTHFTLKLPSRLQ
jgi:two-component system, NtrC family, sensor kinase